MLNPVLAQLAKEAAAVGCGHSRRVPVRQAADKLRVQHGNGATPFRVGRKLNKPKTQIPLFEKQKETS